jgi:hypothetical protein
MKSFSNFFGEARTKAGLEAEKKGLTHTGKGYYADKSGTIVAKAEGGERLKTISKAEQQKLKTGEPLNGPQSVADVQTLQQFASKAKQAQQAPAQEAPAQEKQSSEKSDDKDTSQVPRNEGGPSIVITFGRFNPPHIGHQKLMDRVSDEAYKDGSDYMIYPSHSQDEKKNPFDLSTKHNVMSTMFPHHANNIANDPGSGKNIFDVLKDLHGKGYDNVKVVVGDDRVKEFSNITSKYNGKTYNFGKLDVISAGARDEKSDDVEGMSASKMRKAAADNDYDAFKKGLPKDLKSSEAKSIYKQLRRSMNIEEDLWQIAPKLDYNTLREEYYQENIFNVGDIVESLTTGVEGEIIVRGPNYIIMMDEEERTFRQWLINITEKVHYVPEKKILKEFGEWVPIASGPTNSATTTFGYFAGGEQQVNYQTGEPITFTYSALNGPENYPTSITVDQGFGEVHTTNPPPFNQIGLQGYVAPKLNPKYKKAQEEFQQQLDEFRKKEDANFQSIKDTLRSFGTSWEDMRASKKWVKKLGDGTVVAIIPTVSDANITDWTNNVKVVKLRQHPNASEPMDIIHWPNDINYEVTNSQIVSSVKLEIGKPPTAPVEQEYLMPRRNQYRDVNPQLDASNEYSEKIGADYMMGARAGGFPAINYDPFKMGREITKVASADPSSIPNMEISQDDENFIKNLEMLPKGVNSVMSGYGFAGDMALRYAKGDYTPITKSPGYNFDRSVLDLIRRSSTPGAVQSLAYTKGMLPGPLGAPQAFGDLPVRLSLGQFNYRATPNGIEVTDTFNFNDNTNIGALGSLGLGIGAALQNTADRLVDIGNRRAKSKGLNPDDDSFGIPIKYTIPWNEVPQQLKNRLDPKQTIDPIVRKKKKKVNESTWDKLKRYREEKVHWEVGTDAYRIALQQLTPGEKVQSFTGKPVPEPGTPPVTKSVKKKTTK